MQSTYKSALRKACAVGISTAAFLALSAGTAFAGTSISATVTMPSPTTVGDTGIAGSIQLVNNSTPSDNTQTVTISSIAVNTTAGNAGVFSLSASGTQHAGTSCGAGSFTITPGAPGTWTITPNVVLQPANVAGTCQIDFTFNVLAFPGSDDNSGLTGTQAFLSVTGNALNNVTFAPGNAAGTGQTTVQKVTPTIATVPTAGGPIGTVLNDTAILSGGVTPTGNVVFTLYAPSDTTCIAAAVFTNTDTASPYATTAGYTSLVAGTYHWKAAYAGDANNNAVTSPCSDEPVVVTKASPTIATIPSAGGPIGTVLNDTATLSGGASPTGNVVFTLYAPSDATCSAAAVYTDTDSAFPYATTGGYTSLVAGVYHWKAAYAGDANNNAVTSPCSDESVTIAKASPTIATVPTAGGPIGTVLNDTATLSGGSSPTGNVTFKLFSPSDSTCVGPEVYTDTDIASPYATSPGYTSLVSGTYRWTADYAGDANNNAVSSPCTAEPVVVTAPGHIIVDKITDPTGDTTSFSFTTTGTSYTGFSLTDAAAPNNQTLNAGTYSVAETAVTGWTSNGGVCVSSTQDVETPASISLQAGETVTCTFTNTKKAHIITDKVTSPSGSTQSFAFTTTGTGFNGFNLTDAATPNDQEVNPGTFTIAETAVAGWTLNGGHPVCVYNGESVGTPVVANGEQLVLDAGDTVTCTFTNTQQFGHLIVQKTTNPAADLTVFSINASGSGTITGGGAGTVTDALDKNYEVTPGTYSVSETVPSGWTQTSNTCTGVTVAAGETKSCLIVNTKAGQWCSHGYWKQSQHYGSWVGYTPNQQFSSVFENAFPGMTLLQVLQQGGGGLNALGRDTVGELLNAGKINTPYTQATVIGMFNAVFPGTNGAYDTLHAQFVAPENCPLN